jgi:hypothetical protein
MTVKKLIDLLQDFDENMEVKFAYNFGDYWRTEVANDITELDEGKVTYSSYHNTSKVVRTDRDEDEYEDDTTTVVLLR